jgi:hypothetical protein
MALDSRHQPRSLGFIHSAPIGRPRTFPRPARTCHCNCNSRNHQRRKKGSEKESGESKDEKGVSMSASIVFFSALFRRTHWRLFLGLPFLHSFFRSSQRRAKLHESMMIRIQLHLDGMRNFSAGPLYNFSFNRRSSWYYQLLFQV